jgi:hypothetical protein
MLPEYPVFEYVNRNVSDGARIYLLFAGRRAYYCQRDCFYDYGENPALLLQWLRNAGDEKSVKRELDARQLTHFVIREDLLQRYLATNLTPQQEQLWQSFARRHLKGLFSSQGFSLYQIHG